jgi:hypothetical protein
VSIGGRDGARRCEDGSTAKAVPLWMQTRITKNALDRDLIHKFLSSPF